MDVRNRIILFLFLMLSSVSIANSRTGNVEEIEGIFIFPQVNIEDPKYPGGISACMNFIAKNIKYPKSAQMSRLQGEVILNLEIDSEGTIVDVKVAKSVSTELDEEAIRVVRMMPKWIPGKRAGKPVSTRYRLPVNFKIVSQGTEVDFAAPGYSSPRYPGGPAALMKFLKENIKYPESAIKKRIEGKVVLLFDVKKDGSIKNIDISISVNPELDAEAIRVVRMMPKWIPAKKDGKPIRARNLFPVDFRLDDDGEQNER